MLIAEKSVLALRRFAATTLGALLVQVVDRGFVIGQHASTVAQVELASHFSHGTQGHIGLD